VRQTGKAKTGGLVRENPPQGIGGERSLVSRDNKHESRGIRRGKSPKTKRKQKKVRLWRGKIVTKDRGGSKKIKKGGSKSVGERCKIGGGPRGKKINEAVTAGKKKGFSGNNTYKIKHPTSTRG